jgi:toxin ParE1/3/4
MPTSEGEARRYRLTEQAQDDLANVADYSIALFGVEQARKYRDGLFRAFDLLVAFPFLGSDQGAIEPGLRRHVHGSHAIYYVVIEDEIVIAALLGSGEDPIQRFAN